MLLKFVVFQCSGVLSQRATGNADTLTGVDVSRWATDPELAPADLCGLKDLIRNGNASQKLTTRVQGPQAGTELLLRILEAELSYWGGVVEGG